MKKQINNDRCINTGDRITWMLFKISKYFKKETTLVVVPRL